MSAAPEHDRRLVSRASSALAWLKRRGGAAAAFYDFLSDAYWSMKLWLTRSRTDEEHVRIEFREAFGRELDLSNPRTFSEKLQYLKLYDQTPLHAQCADKIRVRDYIRSKVPEDALIPALLITYDVADITPERIAAPRFVIKPNHDSGSVQFCHDRNTFDWASCRRKLARALRRDFWMIGRELQYRDIRRGLIVEEMLISESCELRDYKFYCFGGEPKFLQIDVDRFSGHRRDLFDLEWRKMDVQYSIPNSNLNIPRPDTLPLMIEYAHRLAEPFKFVRVDFFSVNSRVYVGEITFHPYSGFRGFTPESFDAALGDMIKLN